MSDNGTNSGRDRSVRTSRVHGTSASRTRAKPAASRKREPAKVTETQPVAPVAKLKGRFALFDTEDGGLHIAYKPDGAEETEHFEIPGKVLKVAQLVQSGQMFNPAQIMAALRE